MARLFYRSISALLSPCSSAALKNDISRSTRRCKTILGHFASGSRKRFFCMQVTRLSKENDNQKRFLASNKLDVNGVRLHYETCGGGDHVLLMMPGALGSTRTDFLPQLEGLCGTKYTKVAFDPRGYGRSIPPDRDWPLEFLQRDADDAAALMKVLGYQKYSLLGWSDGGISAMILAARHPEQVRKLIIWGANAYVKKSDMRIFRGLQNIDKWSERMRQPFVELYGEEYFRKTWSDWVEAYDAYFTQNDGDICREDVRRIQSPTLILHGLKDPMVQQEHPDFLHDNIPHSKMYIMPEGKHNIHLRYAEEFNRVVENFLDEQPAKE